MSYLPCTLGGDQVCLLTLKMLVTGQLICWNTFKQDNYSTVRGNGRCRVGEVPVRVLISKNSLRNRVGGSLAVTVA